MKISWGVKITILYTGFVILIVTLVTMAMNQKVELVSKDYYEQELRFQDRINKSNLSKSLEIPLTWEVKQGMLQLNFPEQFKNRKIDGSIYFFRPSDEAFDKTVSIPNSDSVTRNISTSQLKKGLYKIQISWKVDSDEFYNEGFINVN